MPVAIGIQNQQAKSAELLERRTFACCLVARRVLGAPFLVGCATWFSARSEPDGVDVTLLCRWHVSLGQRESYFLSDVLCGEVES